MKITKETWKTTTKLIQKSFRGREEGKTEYRKIRSKNISGKDKEKLKEYLKMYRSMKK